MTRRPVRTVWLAAALAVVASATPAVAGIETGFADVEDADQFALPIAWLRLEGITRGCNPPLNTAYCPRQGVTRGQMAAFLTRALGLEADLVPDRFADDNGSLFEADINQLAAAGITTGCTATKYCPAAPVTRGQMAAFMVRAFYLPTVAEDRFTDDSGSVFEDEINALAAAGLTVGCNPPAGDRFCPRQPVTRDQMATFLWRARGEPNVPPATRLVAAGDIARCELTSDEATADLLDRLFAKSNGVVAALGDTAYDYGSAQEFTECYEPSWGRHLFRTRPAVGNHEYGTPHAAAYFDYFGPAAGDPYEGWYAYQLGTWQIVVLNSNCGQVGGCSDGSPQQVWLDEVLAAASNQCTLAYMHHPRFSSGVHGDDERLADLWATLEDHNVELALAGHDHNYERLAPLTADGSLAGSKGVHSFIVGTGGTYLRPTDAGRPGSAVLLDDVHGVLALDLDAWSYRWQFIDTAGTVRDKGTRYCG